MLFVWEFIGRLFTENVLRNIMKLESDQVVTGRDDEKYIYES